MTTRRGPKDLFTRPTKPIPAAPALPDVAEGPLRFEDPEDEFSCDGCMREDCPACAKLCEGEPCWYNPETGYTEYCPKHEGIMADKAMESPNWKPALPDVARGYVCNNCGGHISPTLSGFLQRCPKGGWCTHELTGEQRGEPGTASNPLCADGTIQEIAERVRKGQWTTLDLDALADFVLGEQRGETPARCPKCGGSKFSSQWGLCSCSQEAQPLPARPKEVTLSWISLREWTGYAGALEAELSRLTAKEKQGGREDDR